jgi:hypothetical protein
MLERLCCSVKQMVHQNLNYGLHEVVNRERSRSSRLLRLEDFRGLSGVCAFTSIDRSLDQSLVDWYRLLVLLTDCMNVLFSN